MENRRSTFAINGEWYLEDINASKILGPFKSTQISFDLETLHWRMKQDTPDFFSFT